MNYNFDFDRVNNAWIQVKDNKRYCSVICTWNSGGNIILSEMPITLLGMDCFLLLGDDDYLGVYLNRMTDNNEEPFYDEYSVIYLDSNEHIPDFLKDSAKQLMDSKVEYVRKWYGFDYKKECEKRYNGEISYFDLFHDFTPKGELK